MVKIQASIVAYKIITNPATTCRKKFFGLVHLRGQCLVFCLQKNRPLGRLFILTPDYFDLTNGTKPKTMQFFSAILFILVYIPNAFYFIQYWKREKITILIFHTVLYNKKFTILLPKVVTFFYRRNFTIYLNILIGFI